MSSHRAYDQGSARVPMIVMGPGVPPRQIITANFTSLVDIFPTFLDIANVTSSYSLDGYSLAPWLNITARQPTTELVRPATVVSEYFGEEVNAPVWMYRSGSYKLVTYGDEHFRPRLFDLDADPWEMHDIADDQPIMVQQLTKALAAVVDYPAITRELASENRANLRRWMAAFADGDGWQALLPTAYKGFQQADIVKLLRWLNGTAGSRQVH